MRCYKVKVVGPEGVEGFRFAGTSALARETREELMSLFQVKKKDVDIMDYEIPTAKTELLEFVNSLAQQLDEGK